jgi:hypothetical protein
MFEASVCQLSYTIQLTLHVEPFDLVDLANTFFEDSKRFNKGTYLMQIVKRQTKRIWICFYSKLSQVKRLLLVDCS